MPSALIPYAQLVSALCTIAYAKTSAKTVCSRVVKQSSQVLVLGRSHVALDAIEVPRLRPSPASSPKLCLSLFLSLPLRLSLFLSLPLSSSLFLSASVSPSASFPLCLSLLKPPRIRSYTFFLHMRSAAFPGNRAGKAAFFPLPRCDGSTRGERPQNTRRTTAARGERRGENRGRTTAPR